ncbi:hypothetical protein BD560DRAFT_381806 [Blakeslea trispora]|nr:hypothetical protein BD560DRAFT_381806 [Blakeslea trispora]
MISHLLYDLCSLSTYIKSKENRHNSFNFFILLINMETYQQQRPITPPSERKQVDHDLRMPAQTTTVKDTKNPFNTGDSTLNDTRAYPSQRNDTTRRIEHEVLSILKWKNPVRSAAILGLTVGSILLTRWYSLLQIGSSLLTLAIGINLVYVNLVLQSQKVLTNQDAAHLFFFGLIHSDVIHNRTHAMIDRQNVRHYSNVMTEVAETVIRALTRIVFIENTWTSAKWMSIFFVVWKISAHVSTMNIILGFVVSAFVFPRLYISNKDVVDAQLHKGQTLLQSGIKQAHTAATSAVQDTYAKSRAFVAQAGTTGTDAKNTMTKQSVTVKED